MPNHVDIVSPSLLRQHPLPEAGSSKRSRGQLAVVGGSAATPGALLLAGVAGLRVGAGVLAFGTVAEVAVQLGLVVPESGVTVVPAESPAGGPDELAPLSDLIEASDAVVLGPGIDDSEQAEALLARVLDECGVPLVLDAYALGALPALSDAASKVTADVVLSPNQSEAARLLEIDAADLDDDDAAVAARVSQRWKAIVSYQGVVAEGDRIYKGASGHPGLGTSGSGDVLAGAIGGLLARGMDPVWATIWATHLHAAAGDRLAARIGRLGFLARELLDEIPLVVTELEA